MKYIKTTTLTQYDNIKKTDSLTVRTICFYYSINQVSLFPTMCIKLECIYSLVQCAAAHVSCTEGRANAFNR